MGIIRRIRKKIEPDSAKPRYILNVWGMGYKFNGELMKWWNIKLGIISKDTKKSRRNFYGKWYLEWNILFFEPVALWEYKQRKLYLFPRTCKYSVEEEDYTALRERGLLQLPILQVGDEFMRLPEAFGWAKSQGGK